MGGGLIRFTRGRFGWFVGTALLGCAAATAAVAQEEAFVGGRGQAGSFESFDPVLVDEVMTGVIPSGQGWFLFGEGERGGVYGWLDGGFVGNFGVPPSKFNGPYNAVDRANEAMMNQTYIIAERTLPTDGSNGIGS
ncbi:MAG: hypothetical protein ACKO40_07245, partial [Planctomycetaceae bacterium]